jgi:ribosomal protein L37AE/L43A
MVFLFVVIIAVVLSGVLLMIATETAGRSGKWGLNLNSIWDVVAGKGLLRKVTCPKCGREQERRRKPVSLTEFLRGGWTCPDCGTSMDKWGKART